MGYMSSEVLGHGVHGFGGTRVRGPWFRRY